MADKKKVYTVKCYYSGYMEYQVAANDEGEAADIGVEECYRDFDISGVDEWEVEETPEDEIDMDFLLNYNEFEDELDLEESDEDE